MKDLAHLLENEVLGDDVKKALQEAFDNKIKSMEDKLQEHYASRYEHDKATIVAAMNNMLEEAIRTELTEFAEDRNALIQQRAKYSKIVSNAKKVYESKMAKNMHMINTFIAKQLHEEISEFKNDAARLDEQRKQMARQVQTIKESAQTDLKNKISKLETFVLKSLSEEIAEFSADKKALVEQRVKLAKLGKKTIQESQTKFVNNATKVVNKTLNEVIKNELVQWRDDIKVARENNFGRRIFEAVAAEYMGSYLSEGSEVKKLQKQLQEAKQHNMVATQKLAKQQQLVEGADAKIRAANDRAQRLETLSELLTPLNREKKAIMEDLLKNIKTSSLREAYDRYLPTVVNHTNTKVNLNEHQNARRETVTGNRKVNTPAVIEESVSDDEMNKLLFLAGINNVKENRQ
jgi:hypothetical protein